MLLETYIMLWILGLAMSFFSFFRAKKGEGILIPYLASLFLFSAGLSSYSIEKTYCESNVENYVNASIPENFELKYDCYSYSKSEPGLGYLGYGLGFLLLFYAIYNSVVAAGEAAVRGI